MSLDSTGERFLPEQRGAIRWEHMHRYLFARELVTGRNVLDVASGEGYGTRLLAERARYVLGVDIAEEAVEHARRAYAQSGLLEFVLGDCTALPMAAASVEVVVSFETIEHVHNPGQVLNEFRRVLRSDGLLVISTPNRAHYPAGNPFHRHEFTAEEFREELRVRFKHVALYGQRIVVGSCLLPLGHGNISTVGFWDDGEVRKGFKADVPAPVYIVALASDAPLPQTVAGFFDHPGESRILGRFIDQGFVQTCEELAAITDSKSWRLLAPLRKLKHGLRRVFGQPSA